MAQGTRESGHALVVGASIAGLVIARALAERFERVTVVDRDRLPQGPEPASRKGVPQDRHVHVLVSAGLEALDELFPGLAGEMAADGAPTFDVDRVRFCLNGQRLAPAPIGREVLSATRPFIEAHVRQRLREHPAVSLTDGTVVRGLETSDGQRRVTGVRVASRDDDRTEQTLPADLVVDCSGRGSRNGAWLAELGYDSPAVDELPVEVRYATRQYRFPPEIFGGDQIVLVGPTPDVPRGASLMRVEGDRWLVTQFGMTGERPPMDPEGYREFAQHLVFPEVAEVIGDHAALDDPSGYRYPASVRSRYERLDDLPAGLLVAGDALASFNPIYGHGMSVAALEAVTLRRLLAEGAVPTPKEWFAAVTPIVDVAWELATGADLAIRTVEGRRSLSTRALNAYLARLHRVAAHDSALTEAFARVLVLIDPPSRLLRPGILGRVLRGRRRAAVSDRDDAHAPSSRAPR